MTKKSAEYWRDPNPSLDLHGMSIEQAKLEVDKFLLSNINQDIGLVKVICGRGKGILMNQIGDYLKTHPCVEKVTTAPNVLEAAWLVELNLD